ncbi:MAG: lipoyl synthase [Elusimicrobia bacterium RIFOXYA2_FULL_58_8]|nr:MAG: lipoyl synthase [Elusimicrobia bacterium RIFOXYA12_FULL_57_11]OGS17328.1 MAG: lipoyl synthase [Elusimicrobia bacterium RIFOXYA2_FULL_58_8]
MTHFPKWIVDEVRRNKAGLRGSAATGTAAELAARALHTVCDEARCPNKGACFAQGEATFLLLGDICTRNCGFCAVKKSIPLPPDTGEPLRAAELCRKWDLKYVVFTSPTRDDLPDGGAGHFAAANRLIKKLSPDIKTEPLIPDLKGDIKALEIVLASNPDVLGHNLEMTAGLYAGARAGADYGRSLSVLANSKKLRPDIFTKSGIMLGLGEEPAELERALADLVSSGCDLLTLGQYLPPSKSHRPTAKYYTEEEFAAWGDKAKAAGFKAVLSGPLVRSSYRAGLLYAQAAGRR